MDAALRETIDRLPAAPGVYLMKDRAGKVIYVGKAIDLRSRVRSYFTRGDGRAFVPLLDGLLGDLEVVLVTNEKEALLLENELIKRHRPRFNVMLRDDKDFIALRLDESHPYPRLEVRRAREARDATDKARYFGPYSSATSIRETLQIVNRHFGLRTCTDHVFATRKRPCILYQIKRCPGPCVYDVPQDEYQESVRETVLFLTGKADELTGSLKSRMAGAATDLRFEQAARLRDQMRAVERSLEKQRTVALADEEDRDVFGFHREGGLLTVYLLAIRGGRIAGGKSFSFKGQEFPDQELMSSFVDLYYDGGAPVPKEVLSPVPLEDAAAKEEWLGEKKGERVHVLAPERGEKRALVEMASENARQAFLGDQKTEANMLETLARLQRALSLGRLPRRMECYDISSFQGAVVVASKVAFEDGEPRKSDYRHFKVKGEAKDDFASMYEVLSRRLKAGDWPDLIVLDGGKGQLSVALAAMRDQNVTEVDVVALAKSRLELEGQPDDGFSRKKRGAKSRYRAAGGVSPERVFLPRVKDPIVLPQNSSELFVLARLRDEAHRFAITFHQKLRRAKNFRSALEEVAGVGAVRRRTLLKHFGSLKRVRAATLEELADAPGMNRPLAERIHRFFHAGEAAPPRAELEAEADALAEEDLGLSQNPRR